MTRAERIVTLAISARVPAPPGTPDGRPEQGRVAVDTVAGRILLVDDQEDVRRMLVTALQIEGYHVDEAASARDGLEHLQTAHYDLVLTDYAMPGLTGTWMLEQAVRQGLLNGTATLIVSAHPDVNRRSDVEVISKSLDLDSFLDQVRRILEHVPRLSADDKGDGEAPSVESKALRPRRSDGDHDREKRSSSHCPDPIELILYIGAHSPRSAAAIEKIRDVIKRFRFSRVRLTIHDLSKNASPGNGDRLPFTPALVKRSPGPRTYILGHITSPKLLIALLEECEEESNK